MADISVRGVSKTYDGTTLAVDAIDLEVADGELLVLVGPSGCGKSTLLRIVAGLEEPSAGQILIGGRDVTKLQPKHRDIAMVFQSYALYPHLTVSRNIGYPLRLAKVPAGEVDERVRAMARLLHLEEVLDRRPAQLSGGQRQRVAMGRALVRQPQGFLMDEPLSNLDAKLRVEMRAEIARLQRAAAVTTLYVTHDQIEAMTMGDRVAVLADGRLQQVAAPEELYDAPVNLFVATFIGSPAMNLFPATLRNDEGRLALDLGGTVLALDDRVIAAHPGLADAGDREVVAGLRPEAFSDAALEPDVDGDRVVQVVVELVESLGAEQVVHAVPVDRLGADRVVARLPPRSRVRPGDTVKLAIDRSELHLFDAHSGTSLRGTGRP